MCLIPSILNLLNSYQYLALWLEGLALVAIFVWDRIEASQQHEQTFAQMEIMRNQARATETAANAAKESADAYVSGERAWVVGELTPLALRYSDGRWYRFVGNQPVEMSNKEVIAGDHLQYTLKLVNLGKTPAFILSYEIHCSRINAPKELLASGKPYQFIAGGGADDLEIVNIFEFSKTVSHDNEGFISVTVSYQHVFSKTYVAEEFFVYMFSRERDVLQRVVGLPPATYEKQRKQETGPN